MVYRIRPEKKGIAGKRPRTSPFQVSRILAKSEIIDTLLAFIKGRSNYQSFSSCRANHFAWRITTHNGTNKSTEEGNSRQSGQDCG